ncbi:MAG: MBL fold metallo-hydrolase, partial [Burkholderiaceae bacterium]
FDLVLIPIGAYAPRWFMKDQHVDPQEAAKIHKDLRARQSVAYHWGTFSLSNEALDDPPVALVAALQEQGIAMDEFSAIAIGETRKLPSRFAR